MQNPLDTFTHCFSEPWFGRKTFERNSFFIYSKWTIESLANRCRFDYFYLKCLSTEFAMNK